MKQKKCDRAGCKNKFAPRVDKRFCCRNCQKRDWVNRPVAQLPKPTVQRITYAEIKALPGVDIDRIHRVR